MELLLFSRMASKYEADFSRNVFKPILLLVINGQSIQVRVVVYKSPSKLRWRKLIISHYRPHQSVAETELFAIALQIGGI